MMIDARTVSLGTLESGASRGQGQYACFCGVCGQTAVPGGLTYQYGSGYRNSLRQPSDARHVGQKDARSGQQVDVGGADLLPKRGGGGELAQGEGSQRHWGKPRADARGLTGVRCRTAGHGRGPPHCLRRNAERCAPSQMRTFTVIRFI